MSEEHDDIEMSATEIAELYIAQNDRWVNKGEWVEGQINAITVWERLISRDPERCWPVFVEILARRTDDEMLYQVGHRLRLLLYRHYDAFVERARALVRSVPRFPRIVGAEFFDRDRYFDKPLDVDALIDAHEAAHRHQHNAHRIESFIQTDPLRALELAIEIIHRGPEHGLSSFDTFSSLRDLLVKHGAVVIDRVEEIARASYLVRRCLWRMVPGQRGPRHSWEIADVIWNRLITAKGGTTDWSDDTEPQPAPRKLSPMDESILTAWFEYEKNFWAFEEMWDLVGDEPETAWPIFLKMLARSDDESRIGSLAAGPLEDLLKKHGEQFIDRIAAEATINVRLLEALRGVWIFDDDGIHPRFVAMMKQLDDSSST